MKKYLEIDKGGVRLGFIIVHPDGLYFTMTKDGFRPSTDDEVRDHYKSVRPSLRDQK